MSPLMISSFDISVPITCPYCNSKIYCAVLLYNCCDVARERFAKAIEKAITSKAMSYYHIGTQPDVPVDD